ncbi:Rha family transcriptional regulator [Hafnia alvei]|uniref:hypothetical protein n=1 Tax=Hafnia alvei TaxID=569 RepID=UPI002DBADE87|nr:hypothetical protein [Hafnia alvei]MEB7891821.1 Rha family transcriptional regulator [Hafnia alvei]
MNISTQMAMMSSKEIAEITGKEVKNIHVDVWGVLKQLYSIEKDGWDFNHHKNQSVKVVSGVSLFIDNRGYVSHFCLDRRHTEILITGYDVKRRAAVIDRWFQLEQSARTPELPASPKYITSDQVKSGLALLESSCDRLGLSHAAKLQAYKSLQKAAGLPELFPDAEPKPTNTKPPAPAKQPALPLIKQPMSSLTKLLERHEIRAPAQGVYIMMHRQGLVERKYKANTAKLETFWAFTEKGLRFGENVEFSKKAKQTQPRFYDERFKGLLFLLGYED